MTLVGTAAGTTSEGEEVVEGGKGARGVPLDGAGENVGLALNVPVGERDSTDEGTKEFSGAVDGDAVAKGAAKGNNVTLGMVVGSDDAAIGAVEGGVVGRDETTLGAVAGNRVAVGVIGGDVSTIGLVEGNEVVIGVVEGLSDGTLDGICDGLKVGTVVGLLVGGTVGGALEGRRVTGALEGEINPGSAPSARKSLSILS